MTNLDWADLRESLQLCVVATSGLGAWVCRWEENRNRTYAYITLHYITLHCVDYIKLLHVLAGCD